jgi:hypothetical protein
MSWSDWIDSGEEFIYAPVTPHHVRVSLSEDSGDLNLDSNPPPSLVGSDRRDYFLSQVRAGNLDGVWDDWNVAQLEKNYIRHHMFYYKASNFWGVGGWHYWWRHVDSFSLSQFIYTAHVDPAWIGETVFPTDIDKNRGYYYESAGLIQSGWDDVDVSIFQTPASPPDVDGPDGMALSDYNVTWKPGIPQFEYNAGLNVYGPVDGFYSNKKWPTISDGSSLGTLPGNFGLHTFSLSDINELDFTLLITPKMACPGEPYDLMPTVTLDAPTDENDYSKIFDTVTYQQVGFGYPNQLRYVIERPRYKYWESNGVPPMRQRHRDDGLATDARQMKGHGSSLQSSIRRGGQVYY